MTPSFDTMYITHDRYLTELGNKQTKVRSQYVFLIFEINCFRNHENHQRSKTIKRSVHLFFLTVIESCHYRGIFARLKRQKMKRHLKTKI